MRTLGELRDRLIEDIKCAVWRPSMRGGNAEGTELLLLHLLDTLCFIDDRATAFDDVSATFLHGCRRVCGQFAFQHRPFPEYVNEVASVYAEVAFCLGYFQPNRLLSVAEMTRLDSELGEDDFGDRDWTEAELHARYGPPTHEAVGGWTTVACYGCEAREVGWVFLDLARRLPSADDWLPVPLVRDFRKGQSSQMHLLPVGVRWDAGEFGDASALRSS